MGLLFANNASSTLASLIDDTGTTVVVQTADASLFPSPSAADDYFVVVLENRLVNPVAREIVKCTARVGNQLTVVRAQENTTAQSWPAGVTVANRITAGSLQVIMAGTNATVQLYLGSFASAPAQTLEGRSLVTGNLYFDTTLNQLMQYNGVSWQPAVTNTKTTSFGVYLGSFAVPPLTMPDGSALVAGTLYYDSAGHQLKVWDGSAWVASTSTTSITNTGASSSTVEGDQTITGNLNVQGDGHFSNVTVDNDTSTTTLHLNGKLVADVGDVSGTADSQNFPAGTGMKKGSGVTDSSGNAHVTFTTPFTGTPVVLPVARGGRSGNWAIPLNETQFGFDVYTSDSPSTDHGTGPVAFTWIAWGPIV